MELLNNAGKNIIKGNLLKFYSLSIFSLAIAFGVMIATGVAIASKS